MNFLGLLRERRLREFPELLDDTRESDPAPPGPRPQSSGVAVELEVSEGRQRQIDAQQRRAIAIAGDQDLCRQIVADLVDRLAGVLRVQLIERVAGAQDLEGRGSAVRPRSLCDLAQPHS
jgi:hypothetical protein